MTSEPFYILLMQLFSWHWPGADELILPIVTSSVNKTTMSIIHDGMAHQPDPSQKLRKLWCCLAESNGDGGLYTQNVTPIFDTNTAAGWVQEVMTISDRTLFCVVYCGQCQRFSLSRVYVTKDNQ
jgi:hypothetical protein